MAIEKTISLAPTVEESTAYEASGAVTTREFKILRQKVGGVQSSLTVAEGEIDLRVTYNDVISAINLSPEVITINASKINLVGYVTLTNLATAGQTTINGGNITTGTMSADRIYGGTINGNTVSVVNLNASNINAGTLSADRVVADWWLEYWFIYN